MADPRPRNRDGISSPLAPMTPRDPAVDAALDAWAADMAREVPTSRLTQAQKNAVWHHIKTQHPDRAAYLQDPTTQRLIRDHGAVPTFPPELIRAALAQAEAVAP